MPKTVQLRIMQSGSGWYWEILSLDREVVACGTADTHAQARAATEKLITADPDHSELSVAQEF